MRVKFIFIVFLLLLSSPVCATEYFPEWAFSDRKDLHKLRNDAYSKQLTALDEPSLFELTSKKGKHVYRFLWLRTFDEPISIRLEIKTDGTGILISKMTNGAGGYTPEKSVKLIKNDTISLSKNTVKEFLDRIKTADYWQRAPYDHSQMGLDGASWIIEGIKEGKYRIVDRWSPDEGVFRDLGLFFLKLSTIEVKEIY